MFSFKQVIQKNSETFYDFASGERKSIVLRFALTIFLSFFLTATLCSPSDNFLNAVLTVQSILVGFSFSVLFFLLSSSKLQETNETSIETKIKIRKLKKLEVELFYNVSYFNIVAISSVVSSLILLLPKFDFNLPNWRYFIKSDFVPEWLMEIAISIPTATSFLIVSAFYFLLLEGGYTIFRTVFRVSFFFEKRLNLMKKTSEEQ